MEKKIVRLLGALVLVAFLAPAAHAVSDDAKCDKSKSKAAGKLFAACMKCLTTGYADGSFDSAACITAAQTKCTEAFTKADTKYPSACLVIGNGPSVCSDTANSCETIYGNI